MHDSSSTATVQQVVFFFQFGWLELLNHEATTTELPNTEAGYAESVIRKFVG